MTTAAHDDALCTALELRLLAKRIQDEKCCRITSANF